MLEWLCTHLMVPKVCQGGYIPFFVTECTRSEAMLVQAVQEAFAETLKEIWLAPTAEFARKRAYDVIDSYAKCFPKAVQCLEDGLEDSLAFYAFPMLDARKISSSSMIERLNREIRRRTSVVGIFLNESSYVCLVTTHLMEYAADGLSPELISARNPLRQLCSLLPNFIFFRSPFCEHYLTRSQKLKRFVTAKM